MVGKQITLAVTYPSKNSHTLYSRVQLPIRRSGEDYGTPTPLPQPAHKWQLASTTEGGVNNIHYYMVTVSYYCEIKQLLINHWHKPHMHTWSALHRDGWGCEVTSRRQYGISHRW